jgi:hypothetical protein
MRRHNTLHVTFLTKRGAERFVRQSHNIPDDCGIGWTPYRVLVTSYGAVSHTAFVRWCELRAWCQREGYSLTMHAYRRHGELPDTSYAVRTGTLSS